MKIMTNEEKAKELGDKLINAVGHTTKDRKKIIDITNEMIEWKEQQMLTKFRDFLNSIGRGQKFGLFERQLKGENKI